MSSSTTFSKAVKGLVSDWAISNIETFDVAVVTDVSKYEQRLVTVLPLCIQEDPDGISPAKPTITDCPVILQGSVDGFLNFPLRKGDKVIIGYPKDSIEEFINSKTSAQYYQIDSMKFQGSQAVVLGAVGQVGVDKTLSTTDFEINYYDTNIKITPDNTVTISTPNGLIEMDKDGNIELSNQTTAFFLYEDGSIVGDNGAGSFTLETAGTILANGAIIPVSGNVITAGGTDLDALQAEVTAFKLVYNTHAVANHTPDAPLA